MTESASGSLKYVMSTIKSSFFPALLFAAGLVMFFAQNPYKHETSYCFLFCCRRRFSITGAG